MMSVVGIVIVISGGLAFFGKRWAYGLFLLLSLCYIPARTGFHIQMPRCEGVPGLDLALFSLRNYAHIILFSIFFVMTVMQFQVRGRTALAWAALATLAMGVFVELAEGATRTGNCRLRDLVPDTAAVILGAIVVLASQRGIKWISNVRFSSRTAT
jgi:hypothetical protein